MKLYFTAFFISTSLVFSQEKQINELDALTIESSPLNPVTGESTQAWSVLDGQKLERVRANTLGETLANEPGISQSFFGPSSSRPIIRGLDKNRIRILQNGVGSFDVSASSEDHAVPVDALLIDRIEVLRGSSALLYGGSAIGGVVNVIDRSIPTRSYAGSSGGTLRSSYNSVNKGWNAGAIGYAGSELLSFQINGLSRDFSEYNSPLGKIKNSMGESSNIGFGGSHIMENGYAGLSYSRYENTYGIPGEHAENKSRIEMKSDRFEARSEIEIINSEWLQSIEVNLGYGDYQHSEIGMEDGVLPFETHSTYLREGIEGRIVLMHEVGPLTGALGFHGYLDDFKIQGEESIFAGSSGTNPAISSEDSRRLAIFLVEEFQLNENTQANGGVRWENLDRDFAGAADRDDSAWSASVGLAHELSEMWNISGNLNYSERLPETSELYSDGAHHATEGYEIGNPALNRETAVGVEVILRRTVGKVTGQVSGFYTEFKNYAFLEDTGVERDTEGNLEPVGGFPAGTEELPERVYESAKAKFYGLEIEIDWLVLENPGWSLLLSAYGDTVRAKNETEGSNLPRISPARLGFGFEIEQEKLNFGMDLKRTFKQDKISEHAGSGGGHGHAETATPAHSMLNAFASYDLEVLDSKGEVFVRGYNLTDELAKVHTSFLKDSAPLPGRSVEIGLSFNF